jgi:hypothetical protein
VTLILSEVITASIEAVAQVHAADGTGLDAQRAALALLLMHFNPTAVLFRFGFVWHIADLYSSWQLRRYRASHLGNCCALFRVRAIMSNVVVQAEIRETALASDFADTGAHSLGVKSPNRCGK